MLGMNDRVNLSCSAFAPDLMIRMGLGDDEFAHAGDLSSHLGNEHVHPGHQSSEHIAEVGTHDAVLGDAMPHGVESGVPSTVQQTPRRGVSVATCTSCNSVSLWLQVDDHPMIWPPRRGGVPPHPDMPTAVRTIYNESTVSRQPQPALSLSPDAPGPRSATRGLLSRRGQPERHHRGRGGKWPPAAGNQSDGCAAFNGNASIHELNREDTAKTVASLAQILNLVVERLITEPRQFQAMHDALPEGIPG